MATEALALTVTGEQLDLIKRTIANGATADELKLYLFDCARQGVHPLDKLLHFTKRQGKYTPITSIDFMRIRAAETGEYAGNDDAVFTAGADAKAPPVAATVTVFRLVGGQRCAFSGTARWSEYCPEAGPSGRGDVMWRKMPHTMLGKCAEALALRKGFPRQLAGLYAKEEMDQAGTEVTPSAVIKAPPPWPDPAFTVTPPAEALDPAPEEAELAAGFVRVTEVQALPTKNPSVTRYTITLSTGELVTTINDWKATLAKNYCEDRTPVRVETKHTKFGDELKSIKTADEAREPDPPVPLGDIPF